MLAVLGVFSVIAYPNISGWITDREVKEEVYETVAFIKERKAEVTSGKYGMTQIVLKPNLEVYTMSPQNFFNTYQDISSNSSYKSNRQCDYGYRQSGFQRNRSLETLKLSVSNNDSEVHVYPNGAHNPSSTSPLRVLANLKLQAHNRLERLVRALGLGQVLGQARVQQQVLGLALLLLVAALQV